MFAGFLSFIAAGGVATGVFALVVVMSVMLGFNKEIENKVVGFNAHLIIEEDENTDPRQVVELIKNDVVSYAEIIEGEGIISLKNSESGLLQGVKIRGIDFEELNKLQNIEWYFNPSYSTDKAYENSIIVGSELAYQIGADPDLNDDIEIMIPFGSVSPTGDIIPAKKVFKIVGLFRTNYFEHDTKTVIIPFVSARKLLQQTSNPSLHLWLSGVSDIPRVKAKLLNSFGDLKITSWADSNKKLFSALKLERSAMFGLLALIIIIACISIVSMIMMYVYTRRKELAILASIGSTKKDISRIFIKLGMFVGIFGTIIGMIFGLAVILLIRFKHITLPGSYYLDYLPVEINILFLVFLAFFGVFISAVAAWYPSKVASNMDPVRLLRYE